MANVLLSPDTLWQRTREQTQHALECGALQPIATEYDYVEQDNLRFLVRILANLERKAKAKQKQENAQAKTGRKFNPFLPYDRNLFVSDISDTHLCLLNKYNVLEHHLLIVTRQFEHQETWLTPADFAALQLTLQQMDGLGFYNGGREAGASQKHKHLQVVPFPLVPDGSRLPIDGAMAEVEYRDGIGRSPVFPFSHAIAAISTDDDATALTQTYYRLLEAIDLLDGTPKSLQQTAPYNFLATREWMMVVPRSREDFQGISVNSLGFAGALLVKNAEQMQQLKACQPLQVLTQVSRPIV